MVAIVVVAVVVHGVYVCSVWLFETVVEVRNDNAVTKLWDLMRSYFSFCSVSPSWSISSETSLSSPRLICSSMGRQADRSRIVLQVENYISRLQ